MGIRVICRIQQIITVVMATIMLHSQSQDQVAQMWRPKIAIFMSTDAAAEGNENGAGTAPKVR